MAAFQGIGEKPGLGINSGGDSNRSKCALRVASKLRRAHLQSGNRSMVTAIRKHLDDISKAEALALVLEILDYVEEIAHHPSPVSPATAKSRTVEGEFMTKPMNYAKSMVMLARDMDAQPLGTFAFHAPSVYLPFLQQLAIDLMA